MDIEHRIDIHTQTLAHRTAASATNALTGAVGIGGGYPTRKNSCTSPTQRPYQSDKYPATPDEQVTRALYQESDIDWKTHSLPSLGRVSSDNTLESSGVGDEDCYAIRKSVSRMNKTRNVS